jgi:RNA polymerase sigma factor (TIGR02999 family)
MDSPQEITQLLLAWGQGDQSALERLMPLVEKELRRLARGYLRSEKRGYWLQTTVLIDDVYLKLIDQAQVHWQNRNQFYALAATCMRRVLIDYARMRRRDKRGGGVEHIPLSDAPPLPVEKSVELLALDEALRKLAEQDAQQSRIVEMRYFGGYSVEEVAEILGVSEATVEREWRMARAWLQRELNFAATISKM